MQIETTLKRDDLERMLDQLLPITIDLAGEDATEQKFIELVEPRDLVFIPGEALQMTFSMNLCWPVPVLKNTHRVKQATARIAPIIDAGADGDARLVLCLQLEDIDVKYLPNVLDRAVTRRVNKEIAHRQAEIAWNFSQTLSVAVALPETVDPDTCVNIDVETGDVRITKDAVHLSLPVGIDFGLRPDIRTQVAPETHPDLEVRSEASR